MGLGELEPCDWTRLGLWEGVWQGGRRTGCYVLVLHGTLQSLSLCLLVYVGHSLLVDWGRHKAWLPVPQSSVMGTRFEVGHWSLYPTTVAMS